MRIPSQLPSLTTNLSFNLLRAGSAVTGLDIQPGLVAAVQARVNGSLIAEKAAAAQLDAEIVREGEVIEEHALTEVLRELFKESGLSKRVRIGIANQRTVLRTLELPPVTDIKELAAAVNFQAQEQVPMPLSNAVLDFHPLGIIDTPSGPRQRVVLVAAQRDMVERLLSAVRAAGLIPEGVDLAAFALIRSLYRREAQPGEQPGRVLYLNVDGLTNLAIAEGTTCRFTRVVGGGLEAMAAELAERRATTLAEARALLRTVDLSGPAPGALARGRDSSTEEGSPSEGEGTPEEIVSGTDGDAPAGPSGASELGGVSEELASPGREPAVDVDVDAWTVLENGIREIYGEVRNSLDFHRSQEGGGEVSHVVLSGAAQDVPGFQDALQSALGLEVRSEEIPLLGHAPGVSAHRLAVAAGLATTEAPQ